MIGPQELLEEVGKGPFRSLLALCGQVDKLGPEQLKRPSACILCIGSRGSHRQAHDRRSVR